MALDTPVLSWPETLHHRMVKLDWQDIEDADSYEVQFYNSSNEWVALPAEGVGVALDGSSAVVSDLPEGVFWWLQVRAVSCAGASEWSEIALIFPTNASDWEDEPVPAVEAGDAPPSEPCPVVLGTPVLSWPETLHHRTVKLDWQDIEGADSYEVQFYNSNDEWVALPAEGVGVAFDGSSAVVSDLPEGVFWWLKVRAVSADGESEWSEIVMLFPTNASDWAPAKPTRLAAAAAHDSVTLLWNDPGDDTITGYRILRRDLTEDEDAQFSAVVEDTGTEVTNYIDDTVEPGRVYEYRILALNSQGASEPADIRTGTPAAPVEEQPRSAQPQRQARANVSEPGTIWSGTVTVGLQGGVLYGFTAPPGNDDLDNPALTVGTNDYTIDGIYVGDADHMTFAGFFYFSLASSFLTDAELDRLTLHAGGKTFDINNFDAKNDTEYTYIWAGTGLNWNSETSVFVRITDSDEASDLPGDDTTTGEVDVGGVVTGTLGASGDKDWFKVELEAGVTYVIDMEGSPTGKGTLPDPWLTGINDAGSNSIGGTINDDGGEGVNARLIFTPTATGIHYIEVQEASAETGTYTLWVTRQGSERAGEDLPADETTTGEVKVGGLATGNIGFESDTDLFKVELEAGATYRIDLEGSETSKGTLEDPYLALYDADANGLADNDDIDEDNDVLNSRVTFTPTETATYYLAALSAVSGETGTYTLSVTREAQEEEPVAEGFDEGDTDLPSKTTTTGVVEVNGPAATATIDEADPSFDYDWFRVNLIKGRTYRIDMEGQDSGDATLVNPYLNGIMDDGGNFTYADPDDNSGRGRDARIIFWPNKDGDYYIWAQGRFSDDEGTYRVRVTDITPADDWGTRLIAGDSVGEVVIETPGDVFKGPTGYCAPDPDFSTECVVKSSHEPYGAFNPADYDFEIAGATYTVLSLRYGAASANPKLHLTLDKELPAADKSRLVLYIHDHERGTRLLKFSAADTSVTSIANTYTWTGVSNPWRVGFATSVRIWVPGLSAAIAGH